MSILKKALDYPFLFSGLIIISLCYGIHAFTKLVILFFLIIALLLPLILFSRRAFLISIRIKIRLIVFFVLFSTGCWMYCCLTVDGVKKNSSSSEISSLNRVIASFFPSRGGFESIKSFDSNYDEEQFTLLYYSWQIAVVSFVSMLLYSTFFGLYGVGHVKRWLNFRIKAIFKIKKRVAWIFWGNSEAARVLAQSISEKGQLIIFQVARDSLEGEEMTKNMVLNLYKHQKSVAVFLDGLPDERYDEFSEGERIYLNDIDVYSNHHFILGENSRFNVRLAKAIVNARKLNGFMDIVHIYVRLENSSDEEQFGEWLDIAFKNETNVIIHIVREAQLLAEKYIGKYPLLAGPYPLIEGNGKTGIGHFVEGFEEVRILMIGFGWRGQELVNAFIENSRFISSDKINTLPFAVEIITNDENCIRSYRRKTGGTFDCYNLSTPFGVLDVNSEEFDKTVLGNIKRLLSYGRIVISMGDDELNLSIARRIIKFVKLNGYFIDKGKLFVQIKSDEIYNRLIDVNGDNIPAFSNIIFFGMWKEIFSYENIIEKEDKNELSMWLNWYYSYQGAYESLAAQNHWSSPRDAIGKEMKNGEVFPSILQQWRRTEWFDKRSTFASCVGQNNLLNLLGYEIVGDDDLRPKENLLIEDDVALLLARNEHERWVSFMQTHGVLPWDLKLPEIGTVKERLGGTLKANCRKIIGRHAAIVSFDDLPKVDCIINKVNGQQSMIDDANFTGQGCGIGLQNNLQWNDLKFVYWIPALVKLCGKKIVRLRNKKQS